MYLGGTTGNLRASAGDERDAGFDLWVRKVWIKAWQPTPVFLPGESDRLQSVGLQRVRYH